MRLVDPLKDSVPKAAERLAKNARWCLSGTSSSPTRLAAKATPACGLRRRRQEHLESMAGSSRPIGSGDDLRRPAHRQAARAGEYPACSPAPPAYVAEDQAMKHRVRRLVRGFFLRQRARDPRRGAPPRKGLLRGTAARHEVVEDRDDARGPPSRDRQRPKSSGLLRRVSKTCAARTWPCGQPTSRNSEVTGCASHDRRRSGATLAHRHAAARTAHTGPPGLMAAS